jgi:flagellar hook protein FlgE
VRGVIHRSGGVRSITSCLTATAFALVGEAFFIAGSFHMGFSSSLNTALSGLSTSQQQIEVVGNNIANVNTTGYKSTSIDFKTQFLQNFSFGSAPTSTDGGTNPLQIGLGVQSGAISTDFNNGAVQTTGQDTNMAIQGGGFFILKQGITQVYTRDGDFQLNNQNQLVSSTGQLVQGYGVDSNNNVVSGVLTNVTIPFGSTVAQATTEIAFAGSNLDSNGAVPTSVAQLNSQPLYLSDGAGGVDLTNPPTGGTLLTNVTDSTGLAQFQVGDVINFTGKVNGAAVPTKTLTVTGTTTLSELESFTQGTLGIDPNAGANGGVATTPGSTLTPVPPTPPATTPAVNTAQLEIAGNPGTANDIALDGNSLSITRSVAGVTTTVTPFTWNKTSAANGESVATTMTAYDSLGNPVNVNLTAVLSSKSTTGTTWQFYATSPDGSGIDAATNNLVGSGTLTFDSGGNLLNTTGSTVTVQRANSGASPTLTFNLDFTGTQALGVTSQLAESSQDGAKPGSLVNFSVGNDGTISGFYNNGLTRTVGQIALATFQNNEGLVSDGNNTYSTGPNSGTAVITTPGTGSAGSVTSGALEGSNVDLSDEFVALISASTAFSASSRVITTSEQLLQALLQAAQG